MGYDRVLIEQSIAKQYGVLPSQQDALHYADWAKMVSGLMDDTPLGRIVGIRMEKDPEMLQRYTPDQRRIRSEWQQFCAERARKRLQNPKSKSNWEQQMAALEQMLAGFAGGW